jgi:opacity protein-like surface antigen
MNKLFLAFCLMVASSALAFAQTTDYKRSEFYIGYSNNQVDTGANRDTGNRVRDFFDDRIGFHGFEVAGVGNVSRYVGIKGDISGAYKRENFTTTFGTGATANTVDVETRNSLYNFLGGVQVKDNSSEARVKPFAHVLGGVGHARFKVDRLSCSNATANCANLITSESSTGLAGAFGGGVDVKVSNRVDLRLLQVDYNPVRLEGSTSHNFRFGIGLNFK